MATDNSERRVGNGNLRPFPKGKSGNPKGRPRGSISIVHLIRRVLKEPCDVKGANGRTWAEVLGRSLIANAIKGNGTAIKQLLDRLEGPIPVSFDEETGTLKIQVEYVKNGHAPPAGASSEPAEGEE